MRYLWLVLLGLTTSNLVAVEWRELAVKKTDLYVLATYQNVDDTMRVTMTVFRKRNVDQVQADFQQQLTARVKSGEAFFFGTQTKPFPWTVVRFTSLSSQYPYAASLLLIAPISADSCMLALWESPVPQLKVMYEWEDAEKQFYNAYNELIARLEKLL